MEAAGCQCKHGSSNSAYNQCIMKLLNEAWFENEPSIVQHKRVLLAKDDKKSNILKNCYKPKIIIKWS